MDRDAETLKYHSETGANCQTDNRWQPPPPTRTGLRLSKPPPPPQMYVSKVWESVWPKAAGSWGQDVTYLSQMVAFLHPISSPPPLPQGERSIIFKNQPAERSCLLPLPLPFQRLKVVCIDLSTLSFFLKQKLGQRSVGLKVEV